ncbi:hypothetical protein HG537_0F03800 [Torulaspora globosa]|uniref:Altered inheritance of mitochondria protein 21 n=1 Tax=Torulaspora globosa TaxID=48254 RepID=A0A7H9HWG0_9SACH|nr:hypothetical protein HG537_0F03800 [Torulaspora sp. CBS 2947]
MSSEEIPKIPERPQRVRGHRLNEEINQEKFPLQGSADIDSAKVEGSELPKIPAHRPQRLKNSSSPPSSGSSEQKPSVPETRPHRERKDNRRESDGITKDDGSHSFQESLDVETAPRLPAARPQRARTTPALTAMPSTGPLATVANTDEVERPQGRLDQSMKRSTTENLDMLVQNTSEQLKEMEMLLSKREMAPVRGNSLTRSTKAADVNANSILDNPEQKGTDPNDNPKVEHQAAPKPESDDGQSSAGENDKEETNRGLLQETEQSESTTQEHPDELQVLEPINQDEMKEAEPETELTADAEPPTAPSTKPQVNLGSLGEKEEAEPTRDLTSESELDHPSSDKETKEGDVSLEPVPSVSDDINLQSQKSEESNMPSAKRTAPPVPKKPSSRIAAFQQMLQKQQLEQLQGSNPFRSHESPLSMRSSTDAAPNRSRTALSDERAQFGKNLGTLFANPDMMTGSPISTDKGTESSKLEKAIDNSQKPLSESRQQRARGPRGRKLPSQVANVEKVKTESTNDIELFHLWTIVNKNRDEQNKIEALEDESGLKSAQLSEEKDSFEILSGGTQERRPSLLEDPSQPKITAQESVSEIENLTFDEDPQSLDLKKVDQVNAEQEVEENFEETKKMAPGHNDIQKQATDDEDTTGYSTDLEQEL